MDTRKEHAAGRKPNNNVKTSVPTAILSEHSIFLYTSKLKHKYLFQAYLPRIGVLDEMFEKFFGMYETRNEPLRISKRYVISD